jgi:hypothetical protein
MGVFIDLSGKKFGRLTLIEANRLEKILRYNCLCDCGKTCVVRRCALVSGHTQSCGCYRIERVIDTMSIQNGNTIKNKPEYDAWRHAIYRCYNPKHKRYMDYGGRWIKVCDRWLESFENFLEDMGKRPSKNHSLDRVINDGNYEPSNCRWATPKQQAGNRRSTRLLKMV